MNIREAKQLKRFDQFRRPSANGHDAGFRVYTVTLAYPEGFTASDQHGYCIRCHWNDCSTKPFLKQCERIPTEYDRADLQPVTILQGVSKYLAAEARTAAKVLDVQRYDGVSRAIDLIWREA